jgi:hypothetical protein
MTLQRKYDPDATLAAYEKKKAANQRAIERQISRRNAPEYQQKQKDKREAARTRRMELVKSAEYQQLQREKASKSQEARRLKLVENASKPPATKKTSKKKGFGMKGRTPTAEERKVMDKIGALPCIACYLQGKYNYDISLHHTEGRTKPGAHRRVLPLCDHHHQHSAPIEVRKIYPWLVPIHADGKIGGLAEFQRLNGSIEKLLEAVYLLAGVHNTNH